MTRWFGVRNVLENDGSYEERVTVWAAEDEEAAIALGCEEATRYAAEVLFNGRLVPFCQVYELPSEPGHGAEVFSLIRQSELSREEYVRRFFSTGDEYERVDEDP